MDILTSLVAVFGIGILLFAISGVWPPLVAIESHSMTPNIKKGDLVFVMEEHRFPGDAQVGQTGVVTANRGATDSYNKFNNPGDVIVYLPDGRTGRTPIIHRAMFWVNESENWYDKADPQYLRDGTDGCDNMNFCPAPHGGFVTLGDYNSQYDQVDAPSALSAPVKPAWVVGTGELRVPGLGWLRLLSISADGDPVNATAVQNETVT
jgi:signal peptidase